MESVDEKCNRICINIEGVEKHLSLQIEKLNKELERLKFDVLDIIEQKI